MPPRVDCATTLRETDGKAKHSTHTTGNGHMSSETAAQQLIRQMSPAEQLVAALQYDSAILWEPNPPEGRREGWALCPCGCGERRLFVSIPLDDTTAGERTRD